MPRSLKDIIAHADELAARAENATLVGDGHEKVIARLREAVLARAEAEQAVAHAVHDARIDGLTWANIGLVLGTSGQSARERYAFAPDAVKAGAETAAGERGQRIKRTPLGKKATRSAGSGRAVSKDRAAAKRR